MRTQEAMSSISIALATASFSAAALLQSTPSRADGLQEEWGMGSGHMMMGSLMMFFFLLVVVTVVALVVRWVGGSSPRKDAPTAHGPARGILDERFARGEIDNDEYEERRRLLMM